MKSYTLLAVVDNRTPAVDKGPENSVPSWPHALVWELTILMITLAVTMALSYFFDAPLKEAANPVVPENPAKAPWYFLGLQELVSYSAFAGGLLVPTLALIGLSLIPYLDVEQGRIGRWFEDRIGRRVAVRALVFSLVTTVSVLLFLVKFGWLRNWFPEISQLIITAFNPGTVITFLFAVWSILEIKRTNSVRHGAIALFVCFLVGFTLLTYFGTYHRGPNWDFYWLPGRWPVH